MPRTAPGLWGSMEGQAANPTDNDAIVEASTARNKLDMGESSRVARGAKGPLGSTAAVQPLSDQHHAADDEERQGQHLDRRWSETKRPIAPANSIISPTEATTQRS